MWLRTPTCGKFEFFFFFLRPSTPPTQQLTRVCAVGDPSATKRHFMGVGWLSTLLGSDGSPTTNNNNNNNTHNNANSSAGASPASLYAGRGLEASVEFDAVSMLSESANYLAESANYHDLRVSIDDTCFEAQQLAKGGGAKAKLSLSSEEFTIFVKTFTQKRLEVTVSQALTVLELKQEIAVLERVPVERQKLLIDGQRLDDDRPLGTYNITANSVVHLVMALA